MKILLFVCSALFVSTLGAPQKRTYGSYYDHYYTTEPPTTEESTTRYPPTTEAPTTTYPPTPPATPPKYCDMDHYCCQAKLIPPYEVDGQRRGSNVRALDNCKAEAAFIVNFGTCSVENKHFRWQIDWGDDTYDSGDQTYLGPDGPVEHIYDYYTCSVAKKVCVTVTYCHNSMAYFAGCCDQFVHCIDLQAY